MKINISDNIRAMRKDRALTQEQLAEALGVTVGAVSKWESGASTPELGMILEISSFFETSVDVLVGYDWCSGGMGQAADSIESLKKEKKFAEASAEAEKALKKYPNCFRIVYNSAEMYCLRGLEENSKKQLNRALELYERALELVGMNDDVSIGEYTIKNSIARTYLLLNETENALEQFKRNNYEGHNNCAIGCTLTKMRRFDEAIDPLSKAFWAYFGELMQLVISYANCCAETGKPEEALAAVQWILSSLPGIKKTDAVTYLDKTAAMLLTGCAQLSVTLGDNKSAREYLLSAKRSAMRFDSSPSYSLKNTDFLFNPEPGTAYDSLGVSAVEGVEKMIMSDEDSSEALMKLWRALD